MQTVSHSDSLLGGLNPQQLAAVTWPNKSALVLAGAGSGKTRVLTTRIAWLLSTGQVSPAGILAVTFTNKAAREMQTRLGAMIPVNVKGMWIGTFHGLCNRFLRLHHRDAGLPSTFQILDSGEQQSAIKRLLKSLQLDDEKFPPKAVQSFINGNKEAGRRAGELTAHDAYGRKMIELYAAYDAQCHREGVVDFAELLLRSYEVLQANAALREHYRARFTHILVDEFQDTNRLQYAWLKLLAGGGNAVFAVGDDDQSIYAFRGAEVGNMRSLLHDFAVSEPIRLEQNYRSAGNILSAANALIERNDGRLGKNLWTEAGEGEPIRLYEAYSDTEEAEFIVDEVKALKRDGWSLGDMAILYRSNAQSRALEHALVNGNLPYRVYGGLRFFERQEIKHALAYLRLIANPEDDNALLRVINVPARGIGARSVENLLATSRETGVSLWQAACSAGGRSAASVGKFVLLIDGLREKAEGLTLAETVSLLIDGSGLRDMYEADKREGEERLANLDELVTAAASFVASDASVPVGTKLVEVEVLEDIPAVRKQVGVELKEVWVDGPPLKHHGSLIKHARWIDGSIVEVDDPRVARGKKASCVCLNCGSPLIARRGDKNEHSFAHENASEETPECISRSHALAQEASRIKKTIEVPVYEEITPAKQVKRTKLIEEPIYDSQSALTEFLTAAALEAGEHQAEAGEEALQLMTVHAAKGLEFDAVFVSGLEEGLFPHENSFTDPKGLEEERRLMYVAITRARQRLYFSCAQSRMLHGQSRYPIRSRFVDEVPADLVKVLSAKAKEPVERQPRASWAEPAAPRRASLGGYAIGQSVGHAKFGLGVVINAEGAGDDVRLQINFAEHGIKWLDLRYAKLTPA